MILLFQTFGGKQIDINIDGNQTFGDLIPLLKGKLGLTSETLFFIYNLKEIQHETVLNSANYVLNTIIYVLPCQKSDLLSNITCSQESIEKQIENDLSILQLILKRLPAEKICEYMKLNNYSSVIAVDRLISDIRAKYSHLTYEFPQDYKEKQIPQYLASNEIKSTFVNLYQPDMFSIPCDFTNPQSESDNKTKEYADALRDLYFKQPEKIELLIKRHCPEIYDKFKEKPEKGFALAGMIHKNGKTVPLEYIHYCVPDHSSNISIHEDNMLYEFYDQGYDPDIVRIQYIACKRNIRLLRKSLLNMKRNGLSKTIN